jgi:hypothetical protein
MKLMIRHIPREYAYPMIRHIPRGYAYPRLKTTGIEGWVDLRVGLEAVKKRNLALAQNNNE